MNYNGKAIVLSGIFLVCQYLAAEDRKSSLNCFVNEVAVFDFRPDSVHYSFTAEIRTDQIKSNEKWVFTPVIVLSDAGDTLTYELEPMVAAGRLYQNLEHRNEVFNKKEAGISNSSGERLLAVKKDTIYRVPYQDALKLLKGQKIERVYMSAGVYSCCHYSILPERQAELAYQNADIATPFFPASLKGNGETSENLKIRKVEGHAYLYFDINKSDINISKPNNMKQIQEMTAAFRKILSDPYARFDSAYIKGQSSPEGPFEFNNKLAMNRSRSALGFLKNDLNKLDIPYRESQFNVSVIPEAWDELSDEIASSGLNDEEKQIVLDIIRNTPVKAEREYKLRQRRKTFQYIKNEMLGNIRRVDYAFYLTFKDLTLQEQIALLYTRPDIYTPSDFLAVANHTSDVTQKEETLRIALRYYPEDAEILASLLDLYLETNRVNQLDLLISSLKQKSLFMKNHKLLRNLGVYYLQTGQSELLERELHDLSFNKESLLPETQVELTYLQGLICLQKRNYNQAYTLLASSKDMNTALSLAGLKRFPEAWAIMEPHACTNAREYYIKAVVAAYNMYQKQTIELLEKAFSLDHSLQEAARLEYAFLPLRKNSLFVKLFVDK